MPSSRSMRAVARGFCRRQALLRDQIAEKVRHTVTITARAGRTRSNPAGRERDLHSCVRARQSGQLFRAISLNDPTRRFSASWPRSGLHDARAGYARESRRHRITRLQRQEPASANPSFQCRLRDTISPLSWAAEYEAMSFPAEVSAGLMSNAFRAFNRQHCDPPEANTRSGERRGYNVHRRSGRPASNPDSPMFVPLARTAKELDPEMAVVPYIGTARRRARSSGASASSLWDSSFPDGTRRRGAHARTRRASADCIAAFRHAPYLRISSSRRARGVTRGVGVVD